MRPRRPLNVKPGDWVRVCFHAKLSDRIGADPLVRARLSRPFRADAVCSNAVRIGGDCTTQGSWHKSWVLCPRSP